MRGTRLTYRSSDKSSELIRLTMALRTRPKTEAEAIDDCTTIYGGKKEDYEGLLARLERDRDIVCCGRRICEVTNKETGEWTAT